MRLLGERGASVRVTGSRVGMRVREARRQLARTVGKLQGRMSHGWGPIVLWMAAVILTLEFGPLLIQQGVDGLKELGVWSTLGEEAPPELGRWLTLPVLLAVFLAGLLLRALVRARDRIVVEEFVDYTQSDGQAVKGMAPLLVAELSGLSQLYRDVNEQLSIPLAVGVERRGGFGRGKEPGSFLTVQADEVTDVLSGAVASEAKIEAGPFLIPIGAVLAVIGRLVRGPRLLGSVHRTAAGGGPTLTVQMIGRGPVLTWRVDRDSTNGSATNAAYAPEMIAEMAIRVFTALNLDGSARWKAVQAFTEYLRSYQRSQRTPRARARFLKEAERQLVRAVAEDDSFDLAFYNLGVIYSQLAQQELTAAQSSDSISWQADVRPDEIRDARIAAATLAFSRALERNRGRWQAYYALAVHRFASMTPLERGTVAQSGTPEWESLDEVVRLCERVLELRPRTARAEDLLGMALVRRGEFAAGMQHHRRAVRRYWGDLCRMERREAARPAPTPATLERVRANAAAALHNLGLAYTSQALFLRATRERDDRSVRDRLALPLPTAASVRLRRADLNFHQALKLAPPENAAASHYERGLARDARGKYARAAQSYQEAIRSQPESPEYRAALACAIDRGAKDREAADKPLEDTFARLTPVFARSVERFAPRSVTDSCEATLAILKATLARRGEAARVGELEALRRELAASLDPGPSQPSKKDTKKAIRDLEQRHFAHNVPWQRTQVDLVLARLFGQAHRWGDAERLIEGVIERLTGDRRMLAVGQLGLYRRLAQAQRRAACAERGKKRRSGLQRALRTAEQALRIDPLNAASRREAGRIHFELRQFEEAVDAWTQALSLIPNDPLLYLKLGICHWRLAVWRRGRDGRRQALGDAEGCLREALILCGGEYEKGKAWTRLWLGRVLRERGETDEGLAQLRSAAAFPATRLAAEVLLAEARLSGEEHALAITSLHSTLDKLDTAFQDGSGKMQPRNGDAAEFAEDLTPRRLRDRILQHLAQAAQGPNGKPGAGQRPRSRVH